jgi:(2Fe-2S) ferredoxin
MKKLLLMFLVLLAVTNAYAKGNVAAASDPAGKEKYTFYFSGGLRGVVTIQRDRAGKITISFKVKDTGDSTYDSDWLLFYRLILRFKATGDSTYDIDRELCPLIPAETGRVPVSKNIRRQIIDGNTTTTYRDGSWYKTVVDGNTTIYTDKYGKWLKETVVDGNTTTSTDLYGWWEKTVVDGNTTTTTRADGWWKKTVVDGNTTTTYRDGRWYKTVVDGNTTTTTRSDGWWEKTVVDGNTTTTTRSGGRKGAETIVDKQGYNIFITVGVL